MQLLPLFQWLHDAGPELCALIPSLTVTVPSCRDDADTALALITSSNRTCTLREHHVKFRYAYNSVPHTTYVQVKARKAFAAGRVARQHGWTVEEALEIQEAAVWMRWARERGMMTVVWQAVWSSIAVSILTSKAYAATPIFAMVKLKMAPAQLSLAVVLTFVVT